MDVQTDTAEHVKRLQRCLNDLVVLALPAVWTGHEPPQIANTLVDVLVRMLDVDFAYVRLSGSAVEAARSTAGAAIQARAVGRSLDSWLTAEHPDPHHVIANPAGEGVVSAALFRVGPRDEMGRFVVGSRRPDFPTDIEHLLMQFAANQAAIGLEEARSASQQRRATEELERRVIERIAELASVNEALRQEILERQRATELNRDLAGRLIASQELERQRIARELHDDLSQKIALLNVEVDQLGAKAGSETLRSSLQKISDRIGEIATDVHNLSHELHPSKLQTLGLAAAMSALSRDITKQGGVRVTFSHTAVPPVVDPNVAVSLYRIAQEALHNIARHSQAREAQLRLTRDGDHLTLLIADSGVGFNATDRHDGLGLISMRERAVFLKGQLTIETSPGAGTRIEVRVPLSP